MKKIYFLSHKNFHIINNNYFITSTIYNSTNYIKYVEVYQNYQLKQDKKTARSSQTAKSLDKNVFYSNSNIFYLIKKKIRERKFTLSNCNGPPSAILSTKSGMFWNSRPPRMENPNPRAPLESCTLRTSSAPLSLSAFWELVDTELSSVRKTTKNYIYKINSTRQVNKIFTT